MSGSAAQKTYTDIIYEVRDPVATIWLNRPTRANSIGGNLLADLKHAIGRAEADPRVVGIVITGRGKMFCPGADLDILKGVGRSANAGSDAKTSSATNELYSRKAPGQDWDVPDIEGSKLGTAYFMTLRKPVVAAINGPAAGFGLAIALSCDYRFSTDSTTFTTSFARLGLIAEYGLAWVLPRVVGPAKALKLLWASERISARDAKEKYGFIDELVPGPRENVVKAAVAYIEQLARTVSPKSLEVIKRQVYESMQSSLGKSMLVMEKEMIASLQRPDVREGVKAFVTRKKPNFMRISTSKL